MNNWPEVRLGDVSVINPRESMPKGTETPFISMAQVAENYGGVQRLETRSFSGGGARFRAGDVLVARITPCLENKKIARVPNSVIGVAHGSTEFLVIRELIGSTDQQFLHYLMMTPSLLDYAVPQMNGSSGRQRLAADRLADYQFRLPPLAEQRRIAGVLGALDDLIEVNRGLMRHLDEMVHLLGRDLLTSATERTVIPLTEVAEVSKGYSYKSSELVPGDGWLVNLKNIGRTGTFEARGFKPLTATVKEHQVISNGDVLVAQTDLTQDREVIARPVRVRRGTLEGRLVASLDLAIVRPRPPHTNESIFALLNSDDFRSHALGYCNGTTVLHMGARALSDYVVPALDTDEIEGFTARVRPLREAADALNIEITELETTRDELLPLLMSGRVRVGEDGVAA